MLLKLKKILVEIDLDIFSLTEKQQKKTVHLLEGNFGNRYTSNC